MIADLREVVDDDDQSRMDLDLQSKLNDTQSVANTELKKTQNAKSRLEALFESITILTLDGPLYTDQEKEIIKYYEKHRIDQETKAKSRISEFKSDDVSPRILLPLNITSIPSGAVEAYPLAISHAEKMDYLKEKSKFEKKEDRSRHGIKEMLEMNKKLHEFLISPVSNEKLQMPKLEIQEEEGEDDQVVGVSGELKEDAVKLTQSPPKRSPSGKEDAFLFDVKQLEITNRDNNPSGVSGRKQPLANSLLLSQDQNKGAATKRKPTDRTSIPSVQHSPTKPTASSPRKLLPSANSKPK